MNLNDEKSNSYSRRSNRESIVDVSRMSSSEIGIKLYDCIVDHQYNSFREIWKQIDECNGQTTIKKPKDKHSKSMSTGGTRLSSIVSKISKNRINVNEILNNKRYTPEKIPLIYAVVVNGEDADLLDILLNHGVCVISQVIVLFVAILVWTSLWSDTFKEWDEGYKNVLILLFFVCLFRVH